MPPEKILIVPSCYNGPFHPKTPGDARGRKRLRVLWVGTVTLAKGIQYLVEAARLLPGVDFDVFGPCRLRKWVVDSFPHNLRLRGKVPKLETARRYERADLFVLPTISNNFPRTQLEAMAHGLPVIITPNCGCAVTDGLDGVIVPARNGPALAEAIRRFETDRGLLASMSQAAVEKAKTYTKCDYLKRLCEALESVPDAHQGSRPQI